MLSFNALRNQTCSWFVFHVKIRTFDMHSDINHDPPQSNVLFYLLSETDSCPKAVACTGLRRGRGEMTLQGHNRGPGGDLLFPLG